MLKTQTPIDALPKLDSNYALSAEQIAQFQQDGHIFLRQVATPAEIAAYREPIAAIVDHFDREELQMEQTVAGKMQGWKFVENLWRKDPIMRQFALARRFAQIAADLLGVDSLRIFRDQSYFKEPGGGATAWHQDQYFIPLNPAQMITLWIPLSDVTPAMAPMSFVTGSHKQGYMGISDSVENSVIAFEAAVRDRGFSVVNYGAMVAGDATFHHGWTLHSSRTNWSQTTREAIVIVYYADGAIVDLPPVQQSSPLEAYAGLIRQNNLNACLPGLKSGDVAATPMNPVVYQRHGS